jgi:hypothetical protein
MKRRIAGRVLLITGLIFVLFVFSSSHVDFVYTGF